MDARPTVALVLGGGGALGAFQAGLYEALEEAGVAPDWLAGSSIGALNAALIAGNPPEHRLKRLHEFWNLVAEPATTPGGLSGPTRRAAKAASALRARLLGRPGLYRPHLPRLFVQLSWWGNPSLYDLGPALATICRLIDLDRIHRVGPRLTVNLTDLETGRAVLVDSAKVRLRPEHLIASMGLLPEFPPVEIDGQWLCDGGFSANLPLQAVFEPAPRADLTCIAVDLLGEPGPLVFSVDGMMERSSDLLYANQTRATLALLEAGQAGRIDGVSVRLLLLACDGRGERFSQKIWDFGRHSLAERWRAGYAAGRRLLARMAERDASTTGGALEIQRLVVPNALAA